LIVLDLVDKDGIDETLSEPPGRGTCLMSSSIDDGIGTDPGEQIKKMADDLFERDAFHDEGIGTTPGEQIKKMSEPPGVNGTWSEPHGLGPIPDESITRSEPPGLGLIPSEPRLPTSIVIELDDDDDDDGIFEIPSEPPGLLGSATTVIGIDDNDGVNATWSEPPGLDSCLSSRIEDGIGTAPGEQHKKIRSFGSEPRLPASIHDCIETTPGEHFKKARGFEMHRDSSSWGALQASQELSTLLTCLASIWDTSRLGHSYRHCCSGKVIPRIY